MWLLYERVCRFKRRGHLKAALGMIWCELIERMFACVRLSRRNCSSHEQQKTTGDPHLGKKHNSWDVLVSSPCDITSSGSTGRF
jgi:hypothetical protein